MMNSFSDNLHPASDRKLRAIAPFAGLLVT
jgi:hypothetical protein